MKDGANYVIYDPTIKAYLKRVENGQIFVTENKHQAWTTLDSDKATSRLAEIKDVFKSLNKAYLTDPFIVTER